MARWGRHQLGQVPDGWRLAAVGEVVDRFLSGGTPSTTRPDYWTGPVHWITSASVSSLSVDRGERQISETAVRDSATSVVPAGNLIVGTRVGIGKVAQTQLDLAISQDLTGLVVDRSEADPAFLCRWMSYIAPRLRALGQGTTIQGVTRKDVATLPLLLPPLPEQGKIAAILRSVDEAIERTEAVIAALREVKRGMLRQVLTTGIAEDGRVRDPLTDPDEFQETEIGLLPKGWQVLPLGQIANVDRGKFGHRPRNEPRFYGGCYPFIQTSQITAAGGGVLEDYVQTLNDAGAAISREFPASTIAVTIAANIADTAILGRPMYFPDSVVGVVAKHPHTARYVEMCIRRAKPVLDARAPQLAQKNINLKDLRGLRIPVPSANEQERIAAIYEAQEAAIRNSERTIAGLEVLKRGLMQQLLTGRMRVNA